MTTVRSNLMLGEWKGKQFVEVISGKALQSVEGASRILEACFENHVNRALLYSENLTERFFDLSSGEPGIILQKFRNYGVRVAVVCSTPVKFSTKWKEVMAEEKTRSNFRFFQNRNAAQSWLCQDE